jgi:hypothetical protein
MLKRFQYFFIFILLFIGLPNDTSAQDPKKDNSLQQNKTQSIEIVKAVMCGQIKNGKPFDEAVIFSKTIGEVVCFTDFNSIQESALIYHRWFFRDMLNRTTKLTVNPPRWSTYSSIHVRDSDKGPWHVEITDEQGNILQILRFSIVE